MSMSDIKLLPERNVDRAALRIKFEKTMVLDCLMNGFMTEEGVFRVYDFKNNLVEYHKEFTESDLKDMFYLINPRNFISNSNELQYCSSRLPRLTLNKIFKGLDHKNDIIQTIDKRDDIRYEIANLTRLEMGMQALVLKELFALRDYKLIPVPILFWAAAAELGLSNGWYNLDKKVRDIPIEKEEKFIKTIYSYIPKDQRKLFPFAKKIMEEEKRAKIEARQEKFNNPPPQEN